MWHCGTNHPSPYLEVNNTKVNRKSQKKEIPNKVISIQKMANELKFISSTNILLQISICIYVCKSKVVDYYTVTLSTEDSHMGL